jgi:hypothetical protein
VITLAGHAPESWTAAQRALRWIATTSDFRLSVFMAMLAAAIVASIYLLERRALL